MPDGGEEERGGGVVEDENMAKFVGRALMILAEHLLHPRNSCVLYWRVLQSSSFTPLNLAWPRISNLSYLKFRNSSNALQEPNL